MRKRELFGSVGHQGPRAGGEGVAESVSFGRSHKEVCSAQFKKQRDLSHGTGPPYEVVCTLAIETFEQRPARVKQYGVEF